MQQVKFFIPWDDMHDWRMALKTNYVVDCGAF